jgi:hypothetical protein
MDGGANICAELNQNCLGGFCVTRIRGIYRLRKNIVTDGVGLEQRPGTVELFNDLSIPCRVAEIKAENAPGEKLPQGTQDPKTT